jgi:hypothetical protein
MEETLAQHCSLRSTTTTTVTVTLTTNLPEGLKEILDRRVGSGDPERWHEVARNCTAALNALGYVSVVQLAFQNHSDHDQAFLQSCGFRGVALEIELQKMEELRLRVIGNQCPSTSSSLRILHVEFILGIATMATAVLQAILLRDDWGEDSDEEEDDDLGLESSLAEYKLPALMGTGSTQRPQSRSRAPLVVSSVHQLAEQEMLPPTVGFEDEEESIVSSVSSPPLPMTPKLCRLIDLIVAYAFLLYTLEVYQTYGDLVSGMQFAVAACGYLLPVWQYLEGWSMTKYFTYRSLSDVVQIVLPLHLLARNPACPVAVWACLATEALSIIDLGLLKGPRTALKLQRAKCLRIGSGPEGAASQLAWAATGAGSSSTRRSGLE